MTFTRIVMAYDGSTAATAALAWMQHASPSSPPSSSAASRSSTSPVEAAAGGRAGTIEVVTLTLDLGQRDELEAVRDRALAAGAARAHVLDVRESFARDYLLPALRAGAACDEEGRPMGRALSRPLIARQLVDVARMEGATVVAHGAWRDAADRARIERALRLLAPDLAVRAPLVEWDATEDEIQAFADARGLRLPKIRSSNGSANGAATVAAAVGGAGGLSGAGSPHGVHVTANLWGRCAYFDDDARARQDAGGGAEARADASAADSDAGWYLWTKAPDAAPDAPAFVDIEFERGAPVGISGVGMPLLEIVSSLETIAGAHGVGRAGPGQGRSLASRVLTGSVEDLDDAGDVCEAPAAAVLVAAHAALERAVLPDDVAAPHRHVRGWYRDLVRTGAWTGVAREACQAFIDRTQARVTGSVRLELSRGACRVVDVTVREATASARGAHHAR